MKGFAALARRAAHARHALVVRGGGGGPLARPEPPSQPLAEQDELIWDDGTATPEPALDQFTLISPSGALKWLLGGLSIYGVVGVASWARHSEAEVPWAKKQLVPGSAAVELQEREAKLS